MGIIDPDFLEKLAEFAGSQQQLRTGHSPKKVDAAFVGDALVMVMHDALTAVEKKLSLNPNGTNQLRDFHRQLFFSSSNAMKEKIVSITGREVIETESELGSGTSSLVYAPVTGAMIQVYMLRPEIIE